MGYASETVKESAARAGFAPPVLNVLLVHLRSSAQTPPARDDSFTVSVAQDDIVSFCDTLTRARVFAGTGGGEDERLTPHLLRRNARDDRNNPLHRAPMRTSEG